MMRACAVVAFALVVILPTAPVGAKAKPRDGELASTERCNVAHESYRDWLASRRKEYEAEAEGGKEKFDISLRPFEELHERLPGEAEFSQRRGDARFTCERIVYFSDGLKVVGFIWKPKDTASKKLPLLIYNRGGGQELGKLRPSFRDGFFDYLAAGYVVIGSQYRGNDGGEGHDEEGGAEIADVLNIVPLAKSLGYVDMDNVFMLGESRGGMMTFLAMKHGAPIRAAAVLGAESDLAANLKRRPELEEDNAKQIPDYVAHRDEALRSRSAQAWVQDLNAPLLMLQGGKDWRVAPAQSLALALTLDAARKPFELVVFDDDDHPLSFYWRERDQKIIAWFNAHRRGSSGEAVGDR